MSLYHPIGSMSSPEGTQVHPTTSKSDETLKSAESANVANKRAWQGKSGHSSKSLGRGLDVQVSSFTGGFSSEEDSDSEDSSELSVAKAKTRSLGRREVHSVKPSSSLAFNVSVSQRSAAYKEMVSSTWNSTRSPKHSALKLSDGSDTSPVLTRNPFLQLDKQGKLQPVSMADQQPVSVTTQRRLTSPAHLRTTTGDTRQSALATTSPTRSPTISGASVQMRIKMWAEKEQDTKTAQEKLVHRRSLQSSALLQVSTAKENQESDTLEIALSDDEKSKSNAVSAAYYTRPARDNVYEEIEDRIEREKVREASTSPSDSSPPAASPPQSKTKKTKKGSSKAAKKSSQLDSPETQKRSKWKIKSPLGKRKKKRGEMQPSKLDEPRVEDDSEMQPSKLDEPRVKEEMQPSKLDELRVEGEMQPSQPRVEEEMQPSKLDELRVEEEMQPSKLDELRVEEEMQPSKLDELRVEEEMQPSKLDELRVEGEMQPKNGSNLDEVISKGRDGEDECKVINSEVAAENEVGGGNSESNGIPGRSQRLSYNRRAIMRKKKSLSKSKEEDAVVDDVFSPVSPSHEKVLTEDRASEKGRITSEELPSLFQKRMSNGDYKTRSISREILSIIDSLGTIEESSGGKDGVLRITPAISIIESESEEASGSGKWEVWVRGEWRGGGSW